MTAARGGNRKIMTPFVDTAEALQAQEEETWRALMRGYRLTGLLVSVTRLGLLRELADRELATTSELADQLVADEGLLERMCRALESIGMLAAAQEGWRLTDAGRRLAESLPAAVEMDAIAEDYELWGHLDERARAIALGEAIEAAEEVENRGAPGSVEAARRAALRLRLYHEAQSVRLVEHLQPARALRVVDVAGADGVLARAVCQGWPDAECIVLEEPAMAAVARAACANTPGIQVRQGRFVATTANGGQRLDPLPEPVDVVLLSHVLQGLDQPAQRDLVMRAGKALSPGGCVVSLEFVLGYDHTGPLDVLLWSVRQAAAGQAPGPLLSADKQDALLRSAGLAAANEFWPSPFARAVLAVRPDAGAEPALNAAAPDAPSRQPPGPPQSRQDGRARAPTRDTAARERDGGRTRG